ncbi:MAG: DUF6683 family protein [Vulcanimicrobiota bacterium]
MKKAAVLIIAFISLSAQFCPAQGSWVNPYTGGVWNNPGSCLLDTMIRNRMNQQMLEKSIGRRAQSAPTAPRVQRMTYRPAANLDNAEQLAAALSDAPKDRQELTGFFREALEKYRGAAAGAGRSNDLGYALAFCLGCCYSVANQCDVGDDALNGLARQMDAALAEMPALRQCSDLQRQALAENFAMLGLFVAAGYEQSNARPEARAVYVELARSSFQSLTGLDAGNLTLNSGGMHLR